MQRSARIGLIVLAAVVVLIGGVFILLKSDVPRWIAEAQASAKLGRAVHIGSLDIHFVPKFRVVVDDLKIANMETGTVPNMVEIARVDAVLDPWKLMRGQLDVTLIQVDKPVIVAEKDKNGRGNWQIHDPNQPVTDTAPNFPVRQLVVNDGHVTYQDPTEQVQIGIAVQSQKAVGGGTDRLALEGQGKVGTNRFTLNGKADTVLNLQNNTDKPYAIEMEAAVGETRARIAGTLKEPLRAEGLAADLHLEAHDAYDLYQLTGVAIPPTPPYILDGKLYRDGNIWRLEPFTAKVGQSDLRGALTFDNGGERPKLIGDLTSNRIKLGDFGGFIGANVEDAPKESGIQQAQRKTEQKQAEGKPQREPPPKSNSADVIPDTEIDFQRLKAMDAAIKFRGTRIETTIMPVNEVATEITLENGLLQVKPLRFGIGQGKIDLTIMLNGRQKPAAINTVMNVTRVPIGELLRSLEQKLAQYETSTGVIGGRAEVRGQGNSLKGLLASANGSLGLAMDNGEIGLLLTKIIDLHILEALGVALSGNKPIPIRCAIADFEIIDGILGSKAIVIDTTDSNISAEGSINFKTEEINFHIVPRAKSVGIFSGRTPVNISGTLGDIKIRPEAAGPLARLGAAIALGVVATPFAAPLAFIDAGLGKDSNCAALVREVNAGIDKQKREGPSPGETPLPSNSSGAPK